MVHTKVVFEEGWSFIRGRKQCKPKHVSSGIVVLNVRWSFIRGFLKRGTTVLLHILIMPHGCACIAQKISILYIRNLIEGRKDPS